MKIVLRTERKTALAGIPTKHYVLCEVRVPHAEKGKTRPSIQIGFALDRSGSMHGDSFDRVREAAKQCLSSLRVRDRFSLVVFNDQVDVLMPLCRANSANKAEALERLNAITPGGGTDLGAGWLRCCEQVGQGLREETVGRCVLLTDGIANRGITSREELVRHAAELQKRGVVTSTFGVGAHFDEGLLQAMADSGGGHFYFVADPKEAARTMRDEVCEAQDVSVRNAALEVRPDASLRVECLSRNSRRGNGKSLWIPLGDLTAGEVQSVVFEVFASRAGRIGEKVSAHFTLHGDPIEFSGVSLPAGPVEIRWTRADAKSVLNARADREVSRAAARAIAARAREEGLGLNRNGDFEGAAAVLRWALDKLSPLARFDPVCREVAKGLESEVARYGREMDPMARKLSFFTATSELRGRDADGKAIRDDTCSDVASRRT